MKVDACDRCGSTEGVALALMTRDGIHRPRPIPREEGLKAMRAIDLCESCLVSLAFQWGRAATR